MERETNIKNTLKGIFSSLKSVNKENLNYILTQYEKSLSDLLRQELNEEGVDFKKYQEDEKNLRDIYYVKNAKNPDKGRKEIREEKAKEGSPHKTYKKVKDEINKLADKVLLEMPELLEYKNSLVELIAKKNHQMSFKDNNKVYYRSINGKDFKRYFEVGINPVTIAMSPYQSSEEYPSVNLPSIVDAAEAKERGTIGDTSVVVSMSMSPIGSIAFAGEGMKRRIDTKEEEDVYYLFLLKSKKIASVAEHVYQGVGYIGKDGKSGAEGVQECVAASISPKEVLACRKIMPIYLPKSVAEDTKEKEGSGQEKFIINYSLGEIEINPNLGLDISKNYTKSFDRRMVDREFRKFASLNSMAEFKVDEYLENPDSFHKMFGDGGFDENPIDIQNMKNIVGGGVHGNKRS